MRTVQVADVLKSGRRAAQLSRLGAGVVRFSYLEEYLESPGRAVATTLPPDGEPVLTPAGAVPPFFAGLLPEGRRLTGLRRAVKTSADDELSLLLAVGGDPVGDVQIVPEGQPIQVPEPLITVQRSFTEVSFTDILGQAGLVDPIALAGVQDKASARMISLPIGRADRQFILKVDPPEFPHVVLNEAFFLRLAAEAGLPAAHAEVVHDVDGRPGLLVERFDRASSPDGAVTLLAVEDGAQVMGLYPADKYAVTGEALAIALATRCAARPVALQAIFAQLCFAWLTGNGDVHAKNMSIRSGADGEWRVAPAYDLPSTLPYRDYTMALTMGGKNSGFSRRSLLEFATAIGLPARAAVRTLDGLLQVTSDLPQRLEAAELPFAAQTLRTLRSNLRNRHKVAATGG